MGCCLSRNTTPTTTPSSRKPASHSKPYNSARNPVVEEETVKEVLTETPLLIVEENQDERIEAVEKRKEGVVVDVKQREERRVEDDFEIQSEASEITVATENKSVAAAKSISVSVSVSESGAGEEVMSKSRDRAEVVVSRNQRSVDRSPAKVSRRRPYSGELTAAGTGNGERRVRSPAKRVAPSPEKKTQAAAPRPVRGRSQSPATSNHRNVVNSCPARRPRDPGERSGRRSRSPARTALQNSSNRAGLGSKVNEKVNGGQRQCGEACRMRRAEEEEEGSAAAESLENPLVSMECFIFL